MNNKTLFVLRLSIYNTTRCGNNSNPCMRYIIINDHQLLVLDVVTLIISTTQIQLSCGLASCSEETQEPFFYFIQFLEITLG